MKTLVTGGAGLIGSHLVKRLVDQGRQVVVADDLSKGKEDYLLELGVEIDLRRTDLTDYEQAFRALDGVRSVFHLAARVGSVEFLHGDDMAELLALQSNLIIDANVFKACLQKKVKTLVYASSVSVYPIDRQQSYDVVLAEGDLSYVNPEGGYGWAKFMGETQLLWMRELDIGIARIFNIYGEGAEADANAHVVPTLIGKACRWPEEKFRVWGDGNQTRDLLYVGDAVEALLRLEEKASAPPVVINIGSGHAVPIRVLVDELIAISGKDISPIYEPARPVGPLSRTADIGRATSLLGWEPKVGLADGLRRTFQWLQRRPTIPPSDRPAPVGREPTQ